MPGRDARVVGTEVGVADLAARDLDQDFARAGRVFSLFQDLRLARVAQHSGSEFQRVSLFSGGVGAAESATVSWGEPTGS